MVEFVIGFGLVLFVRPCLVVPNKALSNTATLLALFARRELPYFEAVFVNKHALL